jgi:2-iminobutanoate/2-iminopropanoate deaminase
MKERITTSNAPAAIGPYSQAIRAGNLIFTAGQVGLNPQSGQLVEGGIREQTEAALRNLQSELKAAGCSFSDVVKTTVFIMDMNDFTVMNEVYQQFLGDIIPPARSTVQVAGLPRGAMVEIECVAMIDA